jgi:hypothetical protein
VGQERLGPSYFFFCSVHALLKNIAGHLSLPKKKIHYNTKKNPVRLAVQ